MRMQLRTYHDYMYGRYHAGTRTLYMHVYIMYMMYMYRYMYMYLVGAS